MALINESIAKRYMVIPLALEKNSLKVAMKNPQDIFAIDDLERLTQMNIVPIIAKELDIHHMISTIYDASKTKEIAKEFKDHWQEENVAANALEEVEAYHVIDAPIVKFVSRILNEARSKKASDIHIEPQKNYIKIRLRIDGQMVELVKIDKSALNALTTRIKILARLDIAERRLPQDGSFQQVEDQQTVDFRVSIVPTIYGEKTVIRILYQGGMNFSIDELGFHPEDKEKVKSLLKISNGIILVTGPTGSGKSTTLATALREINKPNINIMTVEDPVENVIEGVTQIAVNPKSGLTFARILRSILRQDPDVMMIGEMRDLETSEIAMGLAITGHLVLSTLHTNDAISSVTRLIDMGSQPYMIGGAVRGIIAQRLMGKICPKCKEGHEITKKEHQLTQIPLGSMVWQGKGCYQCNQTGYQGRIGVYEVLEVDLDLQEAISKNNSTITQLKEMVMKKGMRSLKDNAYWNVIEGRTTISEMMRISYGL